MDLKEEEILGEAIKGHWYYVSKGRALLDFLDGIEAPEVLDVGAGSGVFSRHLLDQGVCRSAVCVDPFYEEERNETYKGKALSFVKAVPEVTQELILMMDVLEHVDDDVGLLRQYADRMPDNGQVLITVPAFKFMWSGHDAFLEHRRRYTIKMVEEMVRSAGLEPVKTRYFYGLLFPIVAAMRLLRPANDEPKSDLKVYPDLLNKALIEVHDIERNTIFHINKLMGLSVFCLCGRPDFNSKKL